MARNTDRKNCYAAVDAIYRHFTPSPAAKEYLAVPGAGRGGTIHYGDAGRYIAHVQRMAWFTTAFPNHTDPISVIGGSGASSGSAEKREIKIAACHRRWTSDCEWALLRELAHVVTAVPPINTDAHAAYIISRGHTHPFRVNLVRLIRGMLGDRAACCLRRSFESHDLATHRLARNKLLLPPMSPL